VCVAYAGYSLIIDCGSCNFTRATASAAFDYRESSLSEYRQTCLPGQIMPEPRSRSLAQYEMVVAMVMSTVMLTDGAGYLTHPPRLQAILLLI